MTSVPGGRSLSGGSSARVELLPGGGAGGELRASGAMTVGRAEPRGKKKSAEPPVREGNFFDDEKDTVSQMPWQQRFAMEQKNRPEMTDVERSGYTEDGRDLATAGSEIFSPPAPT